MKQRIKQSFKWGGPIGIGISLTFMIMVRKELPLNPLVWFKNMMFGILLGVAFSLLQNISHYLLNKLIPHETKHYDLFSLVKSFIIGFTGLLAISWAANNFITPNFFGFQIIQASLGAGLISVMLTLFFLSLGKKEARLELEKENKQLAVLKERNRIAQELHDSISQKLFGINLNLNSLSQLAEENPEQALDITRQLQQMTEEIQSEMQLMVYGLQPGQLQQKSFFAACEELAELFKLRYDLTIEYQVHNTNEKVPDQAQLALYRSLQETLNNIVQHAKADKVNITLSQQENIKLIVEDDGIGFNPQRVNSAGQFGISGIKERINQLDGEFKLISSPGKGTTIKIVI